MHVFALSLLHGRICREILLTHEMFETFNILLPQKLKSGSSRASYKQSVDVF